MIRIYESPSSNERLQAAAAFVRAIPAGTEAVLVGDTREAVDDFVRALSLDLGATFGLHRFSFVQLVAMLATEELAASGLAPATGLGMEAVAARATFEARERKAIPRLASVSAFPGFPRALSATLNDLRHAGITSAELESAEPGRTELRELAALLELFENDLEQAAIADRATLVRLATERLARARRPFAGARVALLDVAVESSRERALLAELLSAAPEAFATVPVGDERTASILRELGATEAERRDRPSGEPGSLARLQDHLFADEAPPRAEPDEAVRFFSAPGEGRECVEIARAILAESGRGVPFDDMAVFVRAPEIYSAHLETTFRRAGIPAYYARGTKRPDPSGRAFLALLACKADGLSAKRFAEYLSFGQVPPLGEEGAPPPEIEVWVPPESEDLGPSTTATPVQLSLFGDDPEDAEDPGQHAEAAALAPEVAGEPPSAASESPPVAGEPPSAASGPPPDTDQVPELAGSLRAPWKWEEYLVEAAVIGGMDRWRRRLRGLENELRVKLAELENDEPGSARVPLLRRDLENVKHLERFALPLVTALDSFPRRARWGEWLDLLAGLAPRVLRFPERVLAVLADLRPMGAVGPVGVDEVRIVLGERLSTLEQDQPDHRFGRVYVATPEQARGRSFRVVFVPGLAERVFPQRPREDPLLLDSLRERLSPELRTQRDRGLRERLALRLAVGAAEERVTLSFPRVDVVQARPRVPSFYGLDVARATHGVLPDHEELEREAAELVDARLAWPAPTDPERAIDPVEHDLAVLGPLLHDTHPEDAQGRARYLLDLNPHLGRSLRARWIRWRFRKWSPEDGIVRVADGTREALATNRPHERAYSVTALERFAKCPYQFLLAAIHRLEPREDAVALIQMDPLTRGSMIHEIQARTLRELERRGALPVTAARLNEAVEVLDETIGAVADDYREELAPAIERVWEDEVETVRGDLRVWLREMSHESVEWTPKYFEFTFGLPAGSSYDPRSRPEPVTLPGGWKLRGAIDLIEEKTGGDLRVTDHKTGANRTTPGWIVGGGETLQPVLYSLAVESALDREVESARLSFCTTRGGFTERSVALNEWSRMYGRRVLEIIDRAVEQGTLPPAPRKDACKFCDFRLVCGPNEEVRSRRKVNALVADLDALRELP